MLMLAWKIAPALATGCTVVKPAEQTPTSVIMLMELIGDILPAGVLIVTGFGAEAGSFSDFKTYR
jgi:aldehyde dehydrogenase (NAD+)/aldehyde dehydrogenase